MRILVMTDSGKDRNRKLRYMRSQVIVVIACEIQPRPSPSQNGDGIIFPARSSNGIQCGNDGLRGTRSLNQRRDQVGMIYETVFIFMKVPHEIPVSGGVRSRNYRKRIWKPRKSEALLHIHKTFLFKSFYGKPFKPFLFSERKVRIYVIYDQSKAIQLAVAYLNLYKHKHPLSKRGSCN